MFNAPPGSILTVGEHKGRHFTGMRNPRGVFPEGTTIHPGNKRDGSALNNMLMSCSILAALRTWSGHGARSTSLSTT